MLYNKKETYLIFKNESGEDIGNTSFRKCIPKYIIKPKGKTDMCPRCQELRGVELKEHKEEVGRIREEYNMDINGGYDGTILILDFKENIILGKSRIFTCKEFYNNLTPVSCFGIVVLRKGIRKYFDFISDTLNHDSQYVSDCVNFILKKLKIGKKEKLKIWSDGCKGHFKNKNMISNIFGIFKRYQFIEYKFFPSYHGKN